MTVEIKFDVWLTWWAKPLLRFALLVQSSRLVRFVKDHGVRFAPSR